MNAITKAIHIVGLSQLAKECGVTYQAVRKWERGRPPAERCRTIVRVVNERKPGALSLSDLRPDLWPAHEDEPREAA
ncbi:transcriptional regulator [Marichromatium gracile]|uniref:HTH cro/C1-type domain-containing protein n=1 Tax=Marichromatium gracile TaxID=1048 RepID=A0ABR5VEP7_MARGR|nr:YdaS family helix-turn-helix protein [Marichromatium gracile]KXX64200.1 hypothetical protein AY586_14730 [Marichromatium gracile]